MRATGGHAGRKRYEVGAAGDPRRDAERMTTMTPSVRIAGLAAAMACGATASLSPATAAPAPPVAHAARTTTVTLKHISFVKATVRIAKGDAVRWVWKDPTVPHNVTFATRHSTTKQTGTYVVRFSRVGTFRYHCTIHPGMDGKVVVR
jgi:plastocyanin